MSTSFNPAEIITRPLILASASPRRIDLLRAAGLSPSVIPSSYEETAPCPLSPEERAMFFALGKALDVRDRLRADFEEAPETDNKTDRDIPIIIGADTIVVFGGRIMEKPGDKQEGMEMLMSLSGNTHQVITGVCLADAAGLRTKCFYESTDVIFSAYTEAEMDAYLDTDEAYDKAGGYGIQGTFRRYITHVDGDIDNVIGLPAKRLLEELETFDR